MITNNHSFQSLRLVKVAYVYPSSQQFDGIAMDTGEVIRCIQVATQYGGTDFGFTSGIPQPEVTGYRENMDTQPDRRDILAIVAFISQVHICIGFLYPQITQMAFPNTEAHRDRMIERTASDLYRTTTGGAEFEQYHPGDAWFRMAEAIEHEDLTGADYDQRWVLRRNTETNPILTLWNQVRGAIGQWARALIEKQRIELSVNGGSMIEITPNHILLRVGSASIRITSDNIKSTAARIDEDTETHETTGVHHDKNGYHQSS